MWILKQILEKGCVIESVKGVYGKGYVYYFTMFSQN